jgi:hypothetical protein
MPEAASRSRSRRDFSAALISDPLPDRITAQVRVERSHRCNVSEDDRL